MQTVQIDELAAVISEPNGRNEQVSICDRDGSLVGFFVPASEYQQRKYKDLPFTVEQIERAKRQTGGRTLDEILADWERSK